MVLQAKALVQEGLLIQSSYPRGKMGPSKLPIPLAPLAWNLFHFITTWWKATILTWLYPWQHCSLAMTLVANYTYPLARPLGLGPKVYCMTTARCQFLPLEINPKHGGWHGVNPYPSIIPFSLKTMLNPVNQEVPLRVIAELHHLHFLISSKAH